MYCTHIVHMASGHAKPQYPHTDRAVLHVVQYDKNGGKCGVCGDSWDDQRPRDHENGGQFGNGIIGKRYVIGQVKFIIPEMARTKTFFEIFRKLTSKWTSRRITGATSS